MRSILCTYVLDLLGEDDIRATLREARRTLRQGGRLCLASLTFGQTLPSRAVAGLWQRVHSLRPSLVGGCRPIELLDYVGDEWSIVHREIVSTLGLCTEVMVASPA